MNMKRSVLTMIAALVIICTAWGQEKRYEIESAIVKRSSVMKAGFALLSEQSTIQYFADYGRQESAETVMDMAEQKLSVFTMVKDGYVYSANMTANQGTKINMADVMDDYKMVNYLNLTDDVKKKYQIEEKGNEQILGKDCTCYEMTLVVQGQSIKATVWVWKGLALKSSMNVAGMTVVEEATEIQEGAAIPKEKFELPEGIEFQELKMPV